MTYSVFAVMTNMLAILTVPPGEDLGISYQPSAGLIAFLIFIVGCGMGIGEASVYKYVPNYFPQDVGAVGGLVGMLGGLGGFFLPPLFGVLGRWAGAPQMAFLALQALTAGSLAWLHLAVLQMRRESAPESVPVALPNSALAGVLNADSPS